MTVKWTTKPDRLLLEASIRDGKFREAAAVGWEYDADIRVLRVCRDDCGQYEVDVEMCLGPREALGMIAHIGAKTWATPDVLGGLVLALDAVLDLRSLGFQGIPKPIWEVNG